MNLPGLGPVMSVEELNQRVRTVATDLATTPAAAEESFAEKISRAVKEKTARRPDTCKQAQERAEQERSRYGRGGLQRRERTKGE